MTVGPNSDPAAMGWPHRLQFPTGLGDGLRRSQETVAKRGKRRKRNRFEVYFSIESWDL